MYIEGEIPAYAGNGNNATLAYPMMPYGGFGGGFGYGSDAIWIILLLALFGGWGGNGFGGGNNMLYDINANTNRGFDQASIISGINGIQGALSDASVARCNSTTELLQAINGVNSTFQNCCCENRLATADLKYTIATENCADRAVVESGIRDVIESNTRNTQAILDKLCQQEIDAKNDLIATLRSQLSMADLKASQIAQTAELRAGQNAEVDALYNRLSNCPVPSTPVYGRTPIFTCPSSGCGCSGVTIQ